TFRASSNEVPKTLTFGESEVTLGRSNQCDVQLPFTTVSSHHLTFVKKPHNFTVADMGTTNGTFLDGQRLTPHTHVPILRPMQLRIVDIVVELNPVLNMPPEGFTLAESATLVRKMAAHAMSTSEGALKHSAFFEILSGPGCGRRINFLDNLEEAWLGNDPNNEVFIDDARVPPRVARLVGNGEGFDLEAWQGGSFQINGELCTTMHTLRSEDRVIIASMELYFYDPLQHYLDELEIDDLIQPYKKTAPKEADKVSESLEKPRPELDIPDPPVSGLAEEAIQDGEAALLEEEKAPLGALEIGMLVMSATFIVASFIMMLYVFDIL
ncbi:MAG: FHA domain-containing protein, partial [Bradymonadaceae bacterium]